MLYSSILVLSRRLVGHVAQVGRLRSPKMAWPGIYVKTRFALSPATTFIAQSIVVFEALGQLVDIFRWPARHFHSEVQSHLGQHFLDLVQRLAAEVRSTQHFSFRLLHEVTDVDDIVVLQAVCRT